MTLNILIAPSGFKESLDAGMAQALGVKLLGETGNPLISSAFKNVWRRHAETNPG
jgi:glycerate kinase